MKNKIIAIIFLAVFALSVSGCSDSVFNRKFVRKKKGPEGPPQIYHVEPFNKPPNSEIYQHSYLFWGTWEGELLLALNPAGFPKTVNGLKVKTCLENAISNLSDMKECLNEKKAHELDAYIKGLQKYIAIFKAGNVSDNTLARMRDDIEAHKRNVGIRFNYSEIKNDIKDDNSRPESN